MRKTYYDQSGELPSAPVSGEGEAFRPEPYGAVPPQSAGSAAACPAAVSRKEATPVLRKAGGARRFALLLALILVLTGTGILVNGGLPAFRSPGDWAGDIWDELDPDYDWDYYEEESWTAELENTTVKRAPTGDGTVLALTPAGDGGLTPQEIYAKVAPSVVGVRVSLEYGLATGTGVVMSSDGYIITNAHVIAGARRVSVTLSEDGGRTEALLVGYDASTDLAVLKIDAEDLPAADFGDSDLLRVGDPAYVIGNPLGEELRGTMTDGIISAIDRSVDMNGQAMTLLQTNAAMNPGNSGGALVNASGQVVGVTNMKMMSDWETIEGLGFAIPTTLAKEVVDQIIGTGSYAGVPSIGVTVITQTPTAESPAGAYITEVEPGSDAYAKGLRPGDVIIWANGLEVASVRDLEQAKAGLDVGDRLELKVWNGRGERQVTVELMGRNQM